MEYYFLMYDVWGGHFKYIYPSFASAKRRFLKMRKEVTTATISEKVLKKPKNPRATGARLVDLRNNKVWEIPLETY